MKLNIDKPSEGIDYELIPVEDSPNEAAWEIRILKGDYTETVLRFGRIKFDGINDCLTFDFRVSYSPSDATVEDENLQEFAGAVLEDILDIAVTEGWMISQDVGE